MEERICLVVDDDPAIRNYLKAVLGCHGWECLEAGTASEAQRVVENLRGDLHLVLTDVDMPGEMDGIGLAQWVRAIYPAIPVIVVSGSGEVVPKEFPLVSKPCKPETLIRVVECSWRKAS